MPLRIMQPETYTVIQVLGVSTDNTYLVQNSQKQTLLMWKRVNVDKELIGKLQSLDLPFVLQIVDFFEENDEQILIMELFDDSQRLNLSDLSDSDLFEVFVDTLRLFEALETLKISLQLSSQDFYTLNGQKKINLINNTTSSQSPAEQLTQLFSSNQRITALLALLPFVTLSQLSKFAQSLLEDSRTNLDFDNLYNYETIQTLGGGRFSEVLLCRFKQTGQLWVLKQMLPAQNAYVQKCMEREENLVQKVTDLQTADATNTLKNIIGFKKAFHVQNRYYQVMEFANAGTLEQFLQQIFDKNQILDKQLILDIFLQILKGVGALHENGILHRDLKAENVLLHNEGVLEVKVADFTCACLYTQESVGGESQKGVEVQTDNTQESQNEKLDQENEKRENEEGERKMTICGTKMVMAPEMLLPHVEDKQSYMEYGREVDIWNLGVMFYQLVTLELPFKAEHELQLCQLYKEFQVPQLEDTQLQKVLEMMLQKEPKQRKQVSEIIQKVEQIKNGTLE